MTVEAYATCRDHATVFGMGIDLVTIGHNHVSVTGASYRGNMDGTPNSQDTRRPSLEERFRAAGLPVPAPMSDEERLDWERRKQEAASLPRVYGPKRDVA